MSFETVGMSSRNRYGGSASTKHQMSLPVSVKKTHNDFGAENGSPYNMTEPKQSTMRAFSNCGLVDLKDPEGMSSLGTRRSVRQEQIDIGAPSTSVSHRSHSKSDFATSLSTSMPQNSKQTASKFDTLWAYAEPERKTTSSQLRQDAQRVIERYEQGRLERSKRTERTERVGREHKETIGRLRAPNSDMTTDSSSGVVSKSELDTMFKSLTSLTSDIKRQMQQEFEKVNASHKADKILNQQMLARFDEMSKGMDIVTTQQQNFKSQLDDVKKRQTMSADSEMNVNVLNNVPMPKARRSLVAGC